VLVDLIADTPLSTGCGSSGTINNTANATTGWTQIPSSNQKGFYVCIDNTTWNPSSNANPSIAPNQRKFVEIRASASALNNNRNQLGWIGTNTNSRFYDKATYEIITQAFARAN